MKKISTIAIQLIALFLIFILIPATQAQAENVSFDNIQLNANCDSIAVTYTITNTSNQPFRLYVYRDSDLLTLGLTNIPNTNAQHTAILALNPAGNSGEILVVNIVSDSGFFDNRRITCGTGSGGGMGNSTAPNPIIPWSGLSDGRINPDPAEAYTIFCGFDWVFIYGSDPNLGIDILARIHLGVLVTMPDGGQISFTDWELSRQRNIIVVQGNNSYYSPQWRSKTFNLADCLASNTSGSISSLQPDPTSLDYTWQTLCQTGAITLYNSTNRCQT